MKQTSDVQFRIPYANLRHSPRSISRPFQALEKAREVPLQKMTNEHESESKKDGSEIRERASSFDRAIHYLEEVKNTYFTTNTYRRKLKTHAPSQPLNQRSAEYFRISVASQRPYSRSIPMPVQTSATNREKLSEKTTRECDIAKLSNTDIVVENENNNDNESDLEILKHSMSTESLSQSMSMSFQTLGTARDKRLSKTSRWDRNGPETRERTLSFDRAIHYLGKMKDTFVSKKNNILEHINKMENNSSAVTDNYHRPLKTHTSSPLLKLTSAAHLSRHTADIRPFPRCISMPIETLGIKTEEPQHTMRNESEQVGQVLIELFIT